MGTKSIRKAGFLPKWAELIELTTGEMFYIFTKSRYKCCYSTSVLPISTNVCVHYWFRLQSTCWTAVERWMRRACMKRLWESSPKLHHEEDLTLFLNPHMKCTGTVYHNVHILLFVLDTVGCALLVCAPQWTRCV